MWISVERAERMAEEYIYPNPHNGYSVPAVRDPSGNLYVLDTSAAQFCRADEDDETWYWADTGEEIQCFGGPGHSHSGGYGTWRFGSWEIEGFSDDGQEYLYNSRTGRFDPVDDDGDFIDDDGDDDEEDPYETSLHGWQPELGKWYFFEGESRWRLLDGGRRWHEFPPSEAKVRGELRYNPHTDSWFKKHGSQTSRWMPSAPPPEALVSGLDGTRKFLYKKDLPRNREQETEDDPAVQARAEYRVGIIDNNLRQAGTTYDGPPVLVVPEVFGQRMNAVAVTVFEHDLQLVGVTTDLATLMNNDELAYIVGHEFAHHEFRHMYEQKDFVEQAMREIENSWFPAITQVTKELQFRRMQRIQEKQADYRGVDLSDAAGYDPEGAPSAMMTLFGGELPERQGMMGRLMADHPEPKDRHGYLSEEAERLKKRKENVPFWKASKQQTT